MRPLLLPDGRLLDPVELDDPDAGFGLVEIGPEHPSYRTWRAVAEDGEDPRGGQAE